MQDAGTAQDQDVARILDSFGGLMRALGRQHIGQWLEADLTMPQLKTLFVLWNLGHTTVGGLARALGVTLPTVTGILDRLVERGLVTRQEDPDDRRLVVNRLTDSGLELANRFHQSNRSLLAQIALRMSPEDQTMVAEALDKLRTAAEEEGQATC